MHDHDRADAGGKESTTASKPKIKVSLLDARRFTAARPPVGSSYDVAAGARTTLTCSGNITSR